MSRTRATRWLPVAAVSAAALLLAGCIPGGPPSPEQLSEQFSEAIEPAWQVEVPGLFGDVVVRDGLVFAYAADEADGMRLEVRSLEDGELVWDHAASPGGAYANPILESAESASRTYPFPPITPLVHERGSGDDAQLIVAFFERDTEMESIRPDDLLRVADARTGELLDVSVPDSEESFLPFGIHDDGQVFFNAYSPPIPCGDALVCFDAADADDAEGALVRFDLETLELSYEGAFLPVSDDTIVPEWGLGYASVLRDDADGFILARYEDGEQLWEVPTAELFGERTRPAGFVPFVELDGMVLMQGYQSIFETLDDVHTFSLDFTEARTLIAVDPATGAVLWRAPGADMLCYAVAQRPIPEDAETIPACVASDGDFVYDLVAEEFVTDNDVEASIARVDLSDGSIGWEVPDAGEASIIAVTHLSEFTFASGSDYAIGATLAVADGEPADPQLVSLADGTAVPFGEEATFVCKSERADVDPEFEGSSFDGGRNPISTGYPGGWAHFACDDAGEAIDRWSKGAVSVAALRDPGSSESALVVLPVENGIVAFDLAG